MAAQIILQKVTAAGEFSHWEARIGDLVLGKFTHHENDKNIARQTGVSWINARHVVSSTEGDSAHSDRVVFVVEGMI